MEGVDVVFEVFDSIGLLWHGLEVFRPALNVRFVDREGPRLPPLPSDFILVQVLLVLYSLTLLAGDDAFRYDSRCRPRLIFLIGDLEVFFGHHGQFLFIGRLSNQWDVHLVSQVDITVELDAPPQLITENLGDFEVKLDVSAQDAFKVFLHRKLVDHLAFALI